MKNEMPDLEWIERYLDRSLSPSEKKWMEYRLADEPDLKAKYQEHKLLIDGIRYSHLQNKLEQLRTLEQSLSSPKKGKQKTLTATAFMRDNWKSLAVAASICLIVITYVVLSQEPEPQTLFAQRFETYPNIFEPTVRSNSDNTEDKRTRAFHAYDKADYVTASALFTELAKEKEEAGILLLLGNANLALGKTEEAQNNLLTLIKNFNELESQAKWYLALSYLKEGKNEKAELILQELSDPQVTYSKKAKELLHDLK
jgi:tetratricopeptide (TPR) repeat protein